MNIYSILKISLVLSVFGVGFFSAAANTVLTANQVEIIPDRVGQDANATIEELKLLDNQICTLLRIGNRQAKNHCRITFNDKVPQGKVFFKISQGIWAIEFNDRTPNWQRSLTMRGAILARLLAAKLNHRTLAARPERFPAWVVAGIDARIAGSRTAERFLRRNCQLPLIRALLAYGKFPDFLQTMQIDSDKLSAAGLVWYRELCRVLVDSAYAASTPIDNALLNYLELLATGEAAPGQVFRSTLGRVWLSAAKELQSSGKLKLENWEKLDSRAQIQHYLEYFARRLAWHDFSPRPAKLIQKQIDEVLQADLPELDANGEPSGKHFQVDYDDFPDLIVKRPDGSQLLRHESLRLRTIAEGNDRNFRQLLHDLELKLLALPITAGSQNNPDSVVKFQRALNSLREYVKNRAEIEQYLEDFERKSRSPFQLYESRINEAASPDLFLSDRAKKFLEQTEEFYLQD